MKRIAFSAAWAVACFQALVLLSGCGGGSSSTTTKTTPTVTVTPASTSITTTQSLAVTVSVSGSGATPTGTVVLSSGSYASSATTLSGGSASITIPAGSLASGSDTLTAAYTPDAAGSATYSSATGTAPVTVTSSSASITSFTASPAEIASGSSTYLVGYFAGGTGVITGPGISSGGDTVTSGQELSVTPPANATNVSVSDTYTLTVTPTGGGTAVTKTANVTVDPQPAITGFTAAVNSLVAGNSTTLTAAFTGGTGVITPGASGGTTGSIDVTSGTPVTVNPLLTTTFTLTVTPTVGSAATQTLTLTVEPLVAVCESASCSGPQISNLLLGQNLAMWYDDVGNASSILSAFKGAGITAVRWPGGSWSDGYNWNGSDTYPTLGTPTGCGESPVGDDTFANFVSDIVTPGNLNLAITANYGENTSCNGPADPSEAASWAEYAYTLGAPIHYMTIGNEEYGSWENDLHAAADQHNPTVYACEVSGCTNLPSGLSTGLPAFSASNPGFYSAIKTAVENAGGTASTTLVGVSVCAGCTSDDTTKDNWDSTVLSQALGSYDFVEYHYYPESPGDESDTFLVQQAAQEFTANINTIKSELATAGAPATTPIYVGEIGSVSSNPGKQSWSITQGLYAGQILGEAMNDGVARLTWWIGFGNCNGTAGNMSASLYGWQDFGAYNIFSDGTTDYPSTECDGNNIPIGTMSPTAEAFNLAQNVLVAGQYPQQTTVTGDTTDVRAYAATTASGGTALMLFNLNETTPETVSVSLTGSSQASSSDVTVTTYDKEIYDQTDPTCETDTGCSYSPSLTYPDWAEPTTTDLGAQTLPMTLTLQPWSMNVVIVQP